MITRPDEALLVYYIIVSCFGVVFFPFVFIPCYLKYRTLRYEIDDEGVSMSWGVFFRREIYLTYRRIQDIHVTRNLVQRWLGLASVAIQTASGASAVEMSIEGVRHPERLRDFLYSKMRGARTDEDEVGSSADTTKEDSIEGLLTAIRDELRALNSARATTDEATP